jgi:hypothetical protein
VRIEKTPKKVFGSNEEFVMLRLLYNNGDDKFRAEEKKVLYGLADMLGVLSNELKTKIIVEEFEYSIAEEWLKRNSVDMTFSRNILALEFPRLQETDCIFRKYDYFSVWFAKLDDEHLLTNYYYPCEYGHREFFEYRHKLYTILHCLNYDLVDDYPYIALENLTEIIKKDKLIIYLRFIKKRYGTPIYVDSLFLDDDSKIELLDYLYSDVGGEKLFNFMKTNLPDEQYFFDEDEKLDIDDLIRFLYLSKKFYKQLKKEV